MHWSELVFSQWLGLLCGALGAGVFIWVIVAASQMDREIYNAIVDAARENDRNKAVEEARYLSGVMRSIQAAIAITGVLFFLAVTVFLFGASP